MVGGFCPECDGKAEIIKNQVAEAIRETGVPRRADDERRNEFGAKGVIKWQPTDAEKLRGIQSQITLVNWSEPNRNPIYVTVDVGRLAHGGGATFPQSIDPDTASFLSYRVQCQVVLGTPGVMADPYFIDLNRGQRFTAAASYVAVTAQALPPPAPFNMGSGIVTYTAGSLAVFGGLGLGPAPSIAPPEITLFVDTPLAPTVSSAKLEIPNRANYLLRAPSSDPAGTTTITFFDNSGLTVIESVTILNSSVQVPIALPQDAFFVQVTNAGANLALYRVIFQLSV
jgi:hypothetical protein